MLPVGWLGWSESWFWKLPTRGPTLLSRWRFHYSLFMQEFRSDGGFWLQRRSLDTELGRVALRLVGASAAALGLGFGFDLFSDDMFLVFLLAYTVGVFLMPVASLVLGLGVRNSRVFPQWAKWIPFSLPGFALLALGFQVLAPELWDPSDAVWFLAIGVGWILMGLAVAGFKVGWEDRTPGTLGNL